MTSYNIAQRWTKRGTCEVCGRHASRARTFTAECRGNQDARVSALAAMQEQARKWAQQPVMHKGCELFEEDDNEARWGGGGGD